MRLTTSHYLGIILTEHRYVTIIPFKTFSVKNGAVDGLNPQKIAILADSCCDIPMKVALEKGFFIVPLRILGHDGEFADGVDIFPCDIYQRLAAGEMLKTSLPSGLAVEKVLDHIRDQGYEKVIAIMLSSGLSGTYNLLRITAESRTDLEIAVFDSKSGSIGAAMMIYQLLEDIENGMNWETLTAQRVPQLIANTVPFFSVDTLEYLQRGGRIGLITAMAGTMLNIKPILAFAEDGQLKNIAKVRGMKQVQSKFIETIHRLKGEHKKFNLAVANGGAPEAMAALRAQMEAEFPGYDHFYEGEIGATLSVYIGTGILGAAITVLD